MKTFTTLKERSQEGVTHLVDLGEQQPEQVQHWGVTAAAAVAGAVALAAVAKLGIVGTLAYPPVALAAGALGGGLLGWRFMKQRHTHEQPPSAVDQEVEASAVPLEADQEVEAGAVPLEADQEVEAGAVPLEADQVYLRGPRVRRRHVEAGAVPLEADQEL